MPRVTNDREPCPDAPTGFHLWESGPVPVSGTLSRSLLCTYCGVERISRWVPIEDLDTAREETP